MTQGPKDDYETESKDRLTKIFRVAVRDIANIAINILDWALLISFLLLVILNTVDDQPPHHTTDVLIFMALIMIVLLTVKIIFGLWIQEPDRRRLFGFLDLGGKVVMLSGLILIVNDYIIIVIVMCIFGVLTQIYFHKKISRILLSLFQD